MRCALWVPEDKEKRTQAEGAPDQTPVIIVSARLRAPCDAQCAAPPVFHPCGSEAWPVRAAVPAATHISHEAVVQSPSASDGANPPLVFSNDGIVAPAFVQTVDSPRSGNRGTSSLFPRNCQKAPHKRPRNTPLVAVQRYLRLKVVLKVAGRDWAAHPPPVQLQPEH